MPSEPPTTSTVNSGADSIDYRDWLLQPQDMTQPNAGYTVPKPATLNPEGRPGAETMIVSNDSTNAVGITLLILPDEQSAPAGLQQAMTDIATVVPAAAPTSQPVGDEAVSVAGTSRDGSQAATALLFRSGRAIVRIDFYSLPGHPTPADVIVDIGQKQNIALRTGLTAAGHR
jgi:hypothetical protein